MRVSVVIPALNEERGIAEVIPAIPQFVTEIIVVDNGSSDQTASVARSFGAQVIFEKKKGYGIACQAGLRAVKDPDVVVFLDADGSDSPAEMKQLLLPIERGEADFVIGSRILGMRERRALLPQTYWGNKLAVFLIYALTGRRFTDLGPFRAIRYPQLKLFGMRDLNYGWNVEMQMKAIHKRMRMVEVPVSYRRRIGRSKISGTVQGTVKAGGKIIYSIFRYYWITD